MGQSPLFDAKSKKMANKGLLEKSFIRAIFKKMKSLIWSFHCSQNTHFYIKLKLPLLIL